MLAQHAVEVDSEFVADYIEVVEVGEGGVVLHDDEHAAGSDPIGELSGIFRIGKVRVGVLVRVVGRDDYVNAGALEVGERGLSVEFTQLRAELAEEMAEERIARIVPRVPFVVEVDLLAEGVGAQLRVEPAVDDDRLAACQGGLRRVFHFGAGEQERAYALGIVGDDFLADVIGVAAVAIRFAAEA